MSHISKAKYYKKPGALSLRSIDRSMAAPILLGVLFFFLVALGVSEVIRTTAMVIAIAALLVTAVRFDILRKRISIPFIALTLYVIMDGISTFYAVSGKFALREFLKVFLAYCLALILLATSPKNEEQTGKRIATILAVCAALGSLVSIDLVSTRIISGAVTWILGWFTESYAEFAGAQTMERMASIFTNANVFAGVSGLGIILSLGLADTSTVRRERCFFAVLAFLNTVVFILTLSFGAFFFEFIALVVYILSHKRENIIRALVLLLETLVLAALAAVLISVMPAATSESGRRVLPLLCTAVGAAVLCVLDIFAGQKVAARNGTHRKGFVIVVVILVLLVGAYAFASLNLTRPVTLEPDGRIMRMIVFPKPGTYTLEIQAEGEDSIEFIARSQSWQQSAYFTSTLLYIGDVHDATFTIPEGTAMVFFRLLSREGSHIQSAKIGNYRIPLDYKLLPSAITDRLGDIGTFRDLALRIVYFEDGLKLFRRSPVIGLGMGAFENAIKGVQSFYYETKYAHNHYFQTMLETGVVGLLLFLFALISSAIAIWKSRKEHPFAPMLGAAFAFMVGQALFDIVFSAYAYLPLAYGSFALITLCCGETIQKPKLTRAVRSAFLGVVSICIVIYCVFLGGNMHAKKLVEENPTLESLTQAVRLDKFEWADYALPYVTSVMDNDVVYEIRQQADQYAERLATVNSNTIPIYLAQYYFCTDRTDSGFAMVEKYVDYLSSDQSAWQRAFDLLRAYGDGSDAFRGEILRIAEKLEAWKSENLEDIELNDETRAYIAELRA